MAKAWGDGDRSVYLITKDNEAELRPVADRLAQESGYIECYFEPQDPIDPHTFVGFLGSVPVGYLLVDRGFNDATVPIEHLNESWRWKFHDKGAEVWSIGVVWVKPCAQRKGIGRQLCLAACSFFHTTPLEIGWSTPVSDAGQALLRSLGVNCVRLG